MTKQHRKSQNRYTKPQRLNFPAEEVSINWLSMLLDVYFESDQSVYSSITEELTRKGRTLACFKGCFFCCKTHRDIPVYPLELLGLYWFVLEKMTQAHQENIIKQLEDFEPGKCCPFLIDDVCGIHPMRPMACRFFNVFNTPCKEGEDPYYTRRKDVMTPDEKEKNKALSLMLPYHGIFQRAERREAMRNGYIHQFVKNLQNINWPKVAMRLKQKDQNPLINFRI